MVSHNNSSPQAPVHGTVGVVVIGRNEGDRLRRCLESLQQEAGVVAYVDSGSTDGSLDLCQAMAVPTVELDLRIPFTAARARNEGAKFLLRRYPDTTYIQFIDGDCEMRPGWLELAATQLAGRSDVAVVCGRVRERHPEATIYNRLCEMEWNVPVGEIDACGGIAMMRSAALRQVGGYCDSLIAGEEPELCARLRAASWKIVRLDAEMTLHDAAMTRFRQWWRRTVRTGYAYASVSRLVGPERVRIWTRQFRSNWFWGLALPVVVLVMAPFSPWVSLILMVGYMALGLRIYRGRRKKGDSPRDSRLYAFFCVLAKFPHVQGQLRYFLDRLLGRSGKLIEYKGAAMPSGES
jgi:GT2 family glycosyltransferase